MNDRDGMRLRAIGPSIGIGLLTIAVALTGCETESKSAQPAAPAWVALQRTAGADPNARAYVVTLFEDGKVLFEGQSRLRRGTSTKVIPARQAAVVFRELDVIDFWNRPPRYDVDRLDRGADSKIMKIASPDVPWDIITAKHGNRFKRIDGLFFAPSELIELKKLIQTTVSLDEWVDLPPDRG